MRKYNLNNKMNHRVKCIHFLLTLTLKNFSEPRKNKNTQLNEIVHLVLDLYTTHHELERRRRKKMFNSQFLKTKK